MPSYPIAPLFVIPAALMRAVQDSPDYRRAGSALLGDVCEFDVCLGAACVAQPAGGRTDYFLDSRRLDLNAARPVFLRSRERKEEIESRFPLLAPAATIFDYFCHMATNVLPHTDTKPRFFASVAEGDAEISFPWIEKKAFEWSIAIHLGLSPLPMFGHGLKYSDPRVVRSLSIFGLGVYAHLYYAVVPALAVHEDEIPSEIADVMLDRPIIRPPITKQSDGSLVLEKPSES